ncbi:MAG: ribosome small subunit-dependent GTPase A [Bacteroidota bacterium]|jgi:ribosome biogenesis GTPase|nr:ribosome small subunit-dependent GTPase A [Bacteroidota bacterium]
METLRSYGFSDADDVAFAALGRTDLVPARVVAVNRGNYDLVCARGALRGEPTGRLLFAIDDAQELPVVGDWVAAQLLNDDTFALVHDVLPRRSRLRRKDPGRTVEYQMLASNIDVAFCVQSADRDFNPHRLERYFVMIRDGGIDPVVLISKIDLTDGALREELHTAVERVAGGARCIMLSARTGEGVSEFCASLSAGSTSCLLGSSGVGKSTLLNTLLGTEHFATQEVREADHRGRHTTTRRQLVRLDNGALLVDTPGMRELGNIGAETGLAETFGDIQALITQCRFSDCTHTQEKGCAVLAALERGDLDEDRFEHYLKLQREAAYYQRSYVERRQRDKEFGKMVKSILKGKGNKRG